MSGIGITPEGIEQNPISPLHTPPPDAHLHDLPNGVPEFT
jgi:hypothetical protein